MIKTANSLILIILTCINVSGQQVPEVKFNHLYFVLDSHDYKAITESSFFNDTFAACETRTTKADSQATWTGTYLYGNSNYLEFFEASDDDPNLGFLGIGFSVDKIGELNTLKGLLDKSYNTGINGRERTIDSVNIPWFDALVVLDTTLLDSTFLSKMHFWFWIMEYKTAYFDFNSYTIDSGKLTRESYLEKYASQRKNKIVKRFSGLVMKLNQGEREYITKFFENIDYKKLNANEYLSPDNFKYIIKDRQSGDQNSIESIKFETSTKFLSKKIFEISDNITITIEGSEGQISFK